MRRHRLALFSWAWIMPCLSLPSASAQQLHQQQPFRPAETGAAVVRRQSSDGCLNNFYSCASQGSQYNGFCCQYGQTCALDANSKPACCPAGDVCTGTAPSTFVTPTATPSVSYVPNAYFSFPYIVTVFAGPAACQSAVSQCSQNYAACTSDLGGAGASTGRYSVTIIVPGGGGTTVGAPADPTLGSSAASICASLSTQACFGLQSSMCTQAGTTTAGFVIGTSSPARPAAMPHLALVGAVAAGAVGFGLAAL